MLRKLAVPALLLLLGACGHHHGGDLLDAGGIGVTALRTACPQVGIPIGTGDLTLFNPSSSRDATAIDVVANIANLKAVCNDASGDDVVTQLSFAVTARRIDSTGARDVTLPYFVTVVQGGDAVISKRIGHVTLHFDAGQERAEATGKATSYVSRAAATLPDDVKTELTRNRKAGDEDAAVDPLTQPKIRTAVLRATFEALVGFQLTDDQLKYNATR